MTQRWLALLFLEGVIGLLLDYERSKTKHSFLHGPDILIQSPIVIVYINHTSKRPAYDALLTKPRHHSNPVTLLPPFGTVRKKNSLASIHKRSYNRLVFDIVNCRRFPQQCLP